MEWFQKLFFSLTKYQQELNRTITGSLRELSQNFEATDLMILMGITFLYGVVHAVGPGHGKSIVSSYLLLGKPSYKKGLKLGLMISLFHTISASLITFVMYYLLEMVVSRNFQDPYNVMVQVSGGFIILSAFYLIYEHFIKKENHDEDIDFSKKDISIAFSAGVVPCPGVMGILFFSIILKQLYIGVAAAISMSLGMGLTISTIGFVAIYLKNRSMFENGVITKVVNITSITILFILGALLVVPKGG